MTESEFDGPLMVMGSVFGIRLFRWNDARHWLHPLCVEEPGSQYISGENVCCCYAMEQLEVQYWSHGVLHTEMQWAKRQLPHPIESCTHGYYAYWARDFVQYTGPIFGVLEGYGTTVIGPRGFRAEKSRIIALSPGNVQHLAWSWDLLSNSITMAYPDISTYGTVEEMLSWHPLTSESVRRAVA